MSGRLAALLAFLLPTRGRHTGSAAPAVPEPVPDEEEGVSPADLTRFDLPPRRVRPYVWPYDDEDGAL